MITLLAKEKYIGEGRAFSDSNSPLKMSVVLLSNNSSLPSSYSDVNGLEQCVFAPGSILFDTNQSKKYIYNGTSWVQWGN